MYVSGSAMDKYIFFEKISKTFLKFTSVYDIIMLHDRQEEEFANPSYRWHFILLIMGALLLIFLLSSNTSSAEYGAPPENGTTTETWMIEDGDYVVRDDETLSLGGHLGIDQGGTLVLVNTSLEILEENSTFWQITLYSYGRLIVSNNSKIFSKEKGIFLSHFESNLTMRDSSIENISLDFRGNISMKNNDLVNMSYIDMRWGMQTIRNNFIQFKDEFEDNGLAMEVRNLENYTFVNNTIISKRLLYFRGCTEIKISKNEFYEKNKTNFWTFIEIRESNDISISHNLVTSFNIMDKQYSGMHLSDCSNFTIYNNTFESGENLFWAEALALNGSSEGEVFENSFRNVYTGLRLWESTYCDVHDNVFKNNFRSIFIWNITSCEIYNNSIDNATKGFAVWISTTNSRIFNNTISRSEVGIDFLDNSDTCNVYDNKIIDTEIGIRLSNGSHSKIIQNNWISRTEIGIMLEGSIHSCNVTENSIENAEYGIFISNGSNNCNFINNSFSNANKAIYQLNCQFMEYDENEFDAVDFIFWRESETSVYVTDQDSSPITNCKIIISDAHENIAFQGKTDANGNIALVTLVNMTKTNETLKFFNPHSLYARKFGREKTIEFELASNLTTNVTINLTIIIDVQIDVVVPEYEYMRGGLIPLNVTMENVGNVNVTTPLAHTFYSSEKGPVTLHNESFQNLSIGEVHSFNASWDIEYFIVISPYLIDVELISLDPEFQNITFGIGTAIVSIINSPPKIDTNISSDHNISVRKNSMIVINLTSYISDFETDLENLTIGISNNSQFRQVVISQINKTLHITPNIQFTGIIWVNITVFDFDNDTDHLAIPLSWINSIPYFKPRASFDWYSLDTSIQLNLTELIIDEDDFEILFWNYSTPCLEQEFVRIDLFDDILTIYIENDNTAPCTINVSVLDGSNASTSQIVSIIWEVDLFIEDVEFQITSEYIYVDDTFDIDIAIRNTNKIFASGYLLVYMTSSENPMWNRSFDIEGRSSEYISLSWTAIPGHQELEIQLVVTTPIDRNESGHLRSIPFKVYFPLIMNCDESSSIILWSVSDGRSVQITVYGSQVKSIENVTIRVIDICLNGDVQNPVNLYLGIGNEQILTPGITISVKPANQTVPMAKSERFLISLKINDTANCTYNDTITLLLIAEGDDGISNTVTLNVLVVEGEENTTSSSGAFLYFSLIFILGGVAVCVGVMKVSSALSEKYYSMYKISRWFFIHIPEFYFLICPQYSIYREDDEIRHNGYRDKICDFLSARREQGATIREIMEHLRTWFPYGTTGTANPKDTRVTGVVKTHIQILVGQRAIKKFGDRYYLRSYKPSLPVDIYTPRIKWSILLKDKEYNIKGETTCQIISTIFNNGDTGMRNKELASIMGMKPDAMHYHLKKLHKLKIIGKQKGKGRRYFPDLIKMKEYLND